MKTLMLLIFLGTTCARRSHAQTIKPNELSCGNATLTLSMPQALVSQRLKDNGYTLVHTGSAGDTSLPIETWGDEGSCRISFMEGKLVYVARYWESRVHDERSAVEAIVDAVQTVTRSQKHNACDVFSYKDTSPSRSAKSIDIICNGHTIEISVTDDKFQTYDIEESIGSILKKP